MSDSENNPKAKTVAPEAKESDSRHKLIETASKLFAEKGYEGVSTRDIASAANCNISLISYYFNGKEGLYLAILDDFVEQNKTEYAEMVTNFNLDSMDRSSFCSHMKRMIERILARKFSCPHASPMIFREILSGNPKGKEYMETKMAKMADGMINIFEVAKKKGIIKRDLHPATLFFSMIQSIDAYTLMARQFAPLTKRCFELPKENKEYSEQIYKIFIEGALNDKQ